MVKRMMLDDFNQSILRPRVLNGIKRGDFDGILAQMLEEHSAGVIAFDDEIVRAMLKRIPIAAKKPLPDWLREDQSDVMKLVGAQLRIKMPDGWRA